jgi:glycosyltransferase involved in cell wall biosynthesis
MMCDTLILMPAYNDWESAAPLLQSLDATLFAAGLAARVLIVDDGSTLGMPDNLAPGPFKALRGIEVLHLRRNLGHQRAICVGLCHAEAKIPCREIVVMDSDGEDAPEALPPLVSKCRATGGMAIVFAERTRRSEGLTFRIFYHLYRALHRLLVGAPIRVGNFSVIPFARLQSLVTVPELWSHYAAAVFVSRQSYTMIPTTRAKRLAGRSRMNLVSLVVHGLTALSVFSDRIGVRLLAFVAGLQGLVLLGLLAVLGTRLFTPLAIPGWATYSAGLLLILLCQLVMMMLMFCFAILASRTRSTMIPMRDYAYFIGQVEGVYPRQ